MTTNAGASDMSRPAMGFGRDAREGEDTEAIKRTFTPEFRNRLDATIAFSGLTPEILSHVFVFFLLFLVVLLVVGFFFFVLVVFAFAWLGEKGYDPLYGARPLTRVIQEHIKRPLADELLFGTLARGGKVLVTIRDGKPAFDCTPSSTPALLPPPDDADFGALDDDEGDDEADDQEFLPESVA
jgi:ATP-dependent Clp protease ATP-binding subunit ClpA